MKKCYFCKGRLIKKKIQHLHTWGKKIILFEDVEAEVCNQCGEVYFSPKVLKKIDKVATKAFKAKREITIPVVSVK